jgi:hypothetical protein
VAFHVPLIGRKTFGPYTLLNDRWLLWSHTYPFSRTLAADEAVSALPVVGPASAARTFLAVLCALFVGMRVWVGACADV